MDLTTDAYIPNLKYSVFDLKNTHFCFLLYLLRKWSNRHKNFSKWSWV